MANQLSMAEHETILTLYRQGWSKRKIARELGLHRDTVRIQLRGIAPSTAALAAPNAAAPPPSVPAPANEAASGTASKQATPAKVATGSAAESEPAAEPKATPAPETPAADSAATQGRSLCEPFRPVILEKISEGLSAQRIYQDLCATHGFTAAYNSVKRMVRRLTGGTELPFRRLECGPGEEVQVDFGTGAPVAGPNGKRRKTHVLRLILSYSRQGYSEAFFRQTTENFLACLENAFWTWGGVPRTIVIDNLKAAVQQADWYDPEMHRRFCRSPAITAPS